MLTAVQYNKCHRTIKIKLFDKRSSTYIDFSKENNEKDPEFKFRDHVRILKYKTKITKGYVWNSSEKLFVIKKVKNTVSSTWAIEHLDGEEIFETFYEKQLQKTKIESKK